MKIGLISGHGDGDCGAIGCGYEEADKNIELVQLLNAKLNEIGIETVVYPYENNAYKDCKSGGLAVDFSDCKYVLECHFNACVNDQEGNGEVTGTEIYVTPREEHVTVEEKILEKMAEIGFTNRGVKANNFLVINRVKNLGVSSALIETCFIDDLDDMNLYETHKGEVVDAIVSGIVEGFGYEIPVVETPVKATPIEEAPQEETEEQGLFLAKVIIDDLNIRSDACMGDNIVGQTGIGTFTIMEVKDGWGRLKSGAGWIYLGNPNYVTIPKGIDIGE